MGLMVVKGASCIFFFYLGKKTINKYDRMFIYVKCGW